MWRHFKFIPGSCCLLHPLLTFPITTDTPVEHRNQGVTRMLFPLPPCHSQSGTMPCTLFHLSMSQVKTIIFWVKKEIKKSEKKNPWRYCYSFLRNACLLLLKQWSVDETKQKWSKLPPTLAPDLIPSLLYVFSLINVNCNAQQAWV